MIQSLTNSHPRHAELVSASIAPSKAEARGDGWTLKRVQGDELLSGQRRQAQSHGQIYPLRVFAFDQVDLPLPVPALELLFPEDSALHVAEHLEAHEAMDTVSAGKAGDAARPMLMQARDQVRRDADVERPVGLAGQNIDARLAIHSAPETADRWMLKQVQHDDKGRVCA